MDRTLFRAALACLCLALTTSATAQNTNEGSIYSRFGLGELQQFASSQLQAMGGGGTGMPTTLYLNHSNPATWGDQYLTRASAGMLYQNLEASDATGATSLLTEGMLNAVQFSFPIQSNKLGIGFSLAPFSRMSYQVVTADSLTEGTPGDEAVPFQTTFQGSGGLWRAAGGAGYQFGPRLAVGARLDFLFGVLDQERLTSFPTTTAYRSTNLTTSTRLRGVGATVGGLARFADVGRQGAQLTLGATASLPARLAATRVRTLNDRTDDRQLDADTLGTPIEGDVTLPFGATLGAAYRPSPVLFFVADAAYEPWSSFESDLTFAGYSATDRTFQDRLRLSIGAEVLPAGRDQLAPFISRVAYRLGFYTDGAYVTPQGRGDVALRTLAVTGGISLPALVAGTRLDVNFELGTRGTTDNGLVRDRFYRLSANVVIGERWFEKRKLR